MMAAAFLLAVLPLPSEGVATLRLPPTAEIDRAELHYFPPARPPRAVLVLCPGANGNGAALIMSDAWKQFATQHDLGLVGLSFATPQELLPGSSGYYHASKGSGSLLLDGIRKIYGADLPLLLFGISGGAHFTSRFAAWRPDRVTAWCAYSAGWWDLPQPAAGSPPGLVACGEEDPRYGASLIFFKQGRAVGKPWLWISLAKTGHVRSLILEDFARKYFATVLDSPGRMPVVVDIDRESIVPPRSLPPSLTAILPSRDLVGAWQAIHEP